MHFEGDYERDGAVCVRNAFSDSEMKLVSESITQILQSPSSLAKRVSQKDDGAFMEDFCNWQRFPILERFIRQSSAAAIAANFMNSTTVRLYHDHILAREAGTQQPTPWHQDITYYNVRGWQNISMWLPVDSVTADLSLKFIAGSHLGPCYLPRSFLDGKAKWFPEGSLPDIPDFDQPDDKRVLQWSLEPGDCIFFHMRTLHSARGSTRKHRRYVLSVRFLGDDMRHAIRPWTTSPPFPGLEQELKDNAVLEHSIFPVVWESPSRQTQGHVAPQQDKILM